MDTTEDIKSTEAGETIEFTGRGMGKRRFSEGKGGSPGGSGCDREISPFVFFVLFSVAGGEILLCALCAQPIPRQECEPDVSGDG